MSPTNNSSAKSSDAKKAPRRGIWADEQGAVMVEFLVVTPVLIGLFAALMFFHHVSHFFSSTNQLGGVQVWKSAGVGHDARGLSRDDSELFDRLRDDPQAALHGSRGTEQGMPKALGIYHLSLGNAERTPIENLGFSAYTLDSREFLPRHVGGVGAPDSNRNALRNRGAVIPLVTLMGMRMGTEGNVQGGYSFTEIAYTSRLPLITDTYSAYPYGGERHLRYVDRLTVMRDPDYFQAALVQTVISGNPGILMPRSLSLLAHDLGLDFSVLAGLIVNQVLRPMIDAGVSVITQSTENMLNELKDGLQAIILGSLPSVIGFLARPILEPFLGLCVDLLARPIEHILKEGVVGRIEQSVADAFESIGYALPQPQFTGGSMVGGFSSFLEQAQPLRKVDKRMDYMHDVGGQTDYGKDLPAHHRLDGDIETDWTINSELWEMIQ